MAGVGRVTIKISFYNFFSQRGRAMVGDDSDMAEMMIKAQNHYLRDVKNTEILFMNRESLISDKISNIVMPDLIRHPEYNDLDCGFRRNDGKTVL
jgi:hypothetical protein